jgi:hypothetical protein
MSPITIAFAFAVGVGVGVAGGWVYAGFPFPRRRFGGKAPHARLSGFAETSRQLCDAQGVDEGERLSGAGAARS